MPTRWSYSMRIGVSVCFCAILSVDKVVFFILRGEKVDFKAYIMDSAAVNRALARISHEIIERNSDSQEICLVGIMRRGTPIADILSQKIQSLGVQTQVGYLDITLYRDDLSESGNQPTVNSSKLDFSVTGKTVIMVDDVLYTGRTARAAMDAIIALGRPAKIQFATLIDRGHRELPIVADYVGKNVPTSRNEVVVVNIPPFDEETSVAIYNK